MASRILFFLCFLFCIDAFSQTQYGNDWINFSQTYYKLKISSDGVYRITYNQLQQAGIPTQLNPKNIQIYNKGQEVALFVSGENDGTFDSGDFIEFYASKNDGKLDKPLYANPSDQPHDYYSLYTDTATYFLTWSASAAGKRYTSFSAASNNLTPEPYFMHTAVSYFTDGGYYSGKYIISHMSVSEYTEGEGILGALFYPSAPQTKVINTPSFYSGNAPAPLLEAYISSRSNSITGGTYNHHLRIESGKDGTSFTVLKDTLYRDYAIIKPNFSIPASSIGTQTFVRLSAIKDLSAGPAYDGYTDYQAPGYIKITYPRGYTLQGEQALKFTLKGLQNSSANHSLLQFSNSSFASPIFLDLTNNLRIAGTQSAGVLSAVIPGAGTNKEVYLFDANNYNTAELEKVSFTNFNPSSFDKNFLIVTHSSLLSKAQDYSDYRTQAGYKPLVVTTSQLYDQFYYGVHHPLAIRNFCKFLLEKAAKKPEYLLLLGKGKSHFSLRNEFATDLVPGIGDPCSDNMFTSGLDGTNMEPAIPTGRIAAKTPEEVEIYLNKLKTYEQQPDSIWRKNFIHVSGGNTSFENMQWSGFQNTFLKEAQKESFGAWAINFQKNVSEPVTDNLKNKIINNINQGAGFLSFFGHGSAQATEINFGDPIELQNQGKLLVYMINGCNAGNPFTQTSLGEQMIFQPNKAAIGWLATSAEGVASNLGNFSTIFYRYTFNTYYGKSIAENLKYTIKAYQSANDLLNKAHSRQYIWQGDPALKFYTPSKPDYYIENKDLFIYPENVTAATDSFAVAIIAKNLGKAVSSPLRISIKHTLPDNSVVTYPVKSFNAVYNRDTLYYYIKKDAGSFAGTNKFSASIDANNSVPELNEGNNTAEFSFFMPSDGVKILFPQNNSIVSISQIELKAQALKLSRNDIDVVFEIDTVKTFDSNWKKASGNLQLNNIAIWKPTYSPENNKVYYWRVKLLSTGTNDENWQTSSFTYISQSAPGWNESHKGQFEDLALKGTYWNNNNLAFTNTTFITNIQTVGDDVTTGEERAYRSDPGGRLGYGDTNFTGIGIIALNPSTLKTFTYPSIYNIEGFARYSGEFHFNINNPTEVDSMIRYINQIPHNYYVVGHNGRNISLKDLSQAAKTALQSIGLSLFESVGAGEPYMFWGKKGSAPGSAIEKVADLTLATPARSQVIKFQKEYYYPFTQGSFSSSIIGPSKKWNSLQYDFQAENSDELRLSVIGINSNGNETTLLQNITAQNNVALGSVDAEQYPYLKLNVFLSDVSNRTPAKLKSWKVLFDGYSEGSINTNLKNNFHSTSIQEGDSVRWQLAYQNVSNTATDSIRAYYTLTKSDRSINTAYIKTFAPLQAGDSLSVNLSLPTKGLSGNNSLKVEFAPKNNRDLYSFNNYLNQFFTVVRDEKPPLVSVLFDGKSIINNEIVSPKPNIHISVLDENTYMTLADSSLVEVFIKKKEEDDTEYKRVSFSSAKMTFTPPTENGSNKASVEYHPDKFEDGSYTLKIRSKDASGNFNAANDYVIDFEVVNESSISNFYPYPNPFTTSMKFVFTLTGEKIPDKLKIQILTVSGKVVREVFKEELGALKIGNNISDFTWDGTDQFGDRLANGVYFYRVSVEHSDNSAIKHRFTSGDKFFKNNFGKIYLMR